LILRAANIDRRCRRDSAAQAMVSGLRERIRRFLQKPGTVDLTPLRELLPRIAESETRLRALADEDLTAAARAAARDAGDDAEICALGREAARRALDERPYDVQLIGTLAMLSGYVAEMATGEGKTLSGALAAAGYALRGRRVHVMSVNDYLARRDAEWMRPVYDLLGVTVGWIGQDSTAEQRRDAYAADVMYGSVSEIGFDVLRDRLRTAAGDLLVPEPDVALIDEADSVLVDEARVPLVLAGAAAAGDIDRAMVETVRRLHPGRHYATDEEGRSVQLTTAGARAAEQALGGINLYTDEHVDTLTRLNVALHAHVLLQRDIDYIVKDGKVHLINESRGRVSRLQRWPDGLMAAVEAKEELTASETGEILDSITVQALIGRYPTVCGMTGTAVAVGTELREFYQLEVAVIPPNKPCIRADEPERLFLTVEEKEQELVSQVVETHGTGRPILIGTQDVAESERIAARLTQAGLSCSVLNAKNDAEEAAIVAEAGKHGAITVSTQMAGRGTDIRLGGSGRSGDRDQVAALGGLYVIATGRHASSRLDHQLRGRSGRQGDPGGSVFFTSMEDDLVTVYARDVTPPEGESADEWIVDHAQRVAEGVNLEIHRNTWRYNQVIERQRSIVLDYRDRALRTDAAVRTLAEQCPERHRELSEAVDDGVLTEAARQIVLYHLDRAWAEHMSFLADLREGIHLRALGRGLNPLDEFQKEAFRVFRGLLDRVAERSAETFQTARITVDGLDMDAAGLKRPTATWTYLVQDNPFGTDIDRALKSIGSALRRSIRR
jgi:preprotein translocase subunit SecA